MNKQILIILMNLLMNYNSTMLLVFNSYTQTKKNKLFYYNLLIIFLKIEKKKSRFITKAVSTNT